MSYKEPAPRLTAMERQERQELETKVRRNLTAFQEVGDALLVLQSKKLYRETHKTFELYMLEEFGIKRQVGYRFMEAAKVVSNLSPFGDKPEKEAQAREMAPFTPNTQRAIWAETLKGGKKTGESVLANALKIGAEQFDSLPEQDQKAVMAIEKRQLVGEGRKMTHKELVERGVHLLSKALKVWTRVGDCKVVSLIEEAIELGKKA